MGRRTYAISTHYAVASDNHPDTESHVRAAELATRAMVDFADDASDVSSRTGKRVFKFRYACTIHYYTHLARGAVTRTGH
jgi:hypothetical protein